MKPTASLAGRTIVVTRPFEQAGKLQALIAQAGGEALLFPLLEISAIKDAGLLNQAARELNTYSLAIFVSPNAVKYALPALLKKNCWPPHLTPAAVGKGTAKCLLEHGIFGCIFPTERFDSEALLELPELSEHAVSNKRIVIFRGNGGRELLSTSLRARGAHVDCIPCYERSAPSCSPENLLKALQAGKIDAITISSSESLRNLVALTKLHFLKQTTVFVSHARIAENAYLLGLNNIIISEAGDNGMMTALLRYNWQHDER